MCDKCARSTQVYLTVLYIRINMHPRPVQAIDQFDEYISVASGLMGEKCAAPVIPEEIISVIDGDYTNDVITMVDY